MERATEDNDRRAVAADAPDDASLALALLDATGDALLALSPLGEVLSWNGGAEATYGYGRTEAVGRTIEDFAPPAERGKTTRAIERVLREDTTRFATVRRGKGGTEIAVEVTLRAVRGADGDVRFVAAQERAAGRPAVTGSGDAGRGPGDVVARMAHELRTPLNAIIGFAEVIHEGHVAPTSPRVPEFAGDILSSALHLLRLINDIIDLTKAEAGRLELRPEAADVASLVREAVANLPRTAERKSAVDVEVDPRLTEVVLDGSRFKQLLASYLSSAFERTRAGGRVAVRVRPHDDDTLELEVEDEGEAIAADDLPRLFAAFERLDTGAARRAGVSGLALALAKRLAEAQGGSVGARAVPGGGNVLHAVLPRRLRSGPVSLAAPRAAS